MNKYDDVKELIEQIDEPEKVKLTKAQEEYLLSFGDIKSEGSEDWMTALYYIVRTGWGYLFTTAPDAGNDEISLNSDYYKKLSGNLDFDDLKTLLIKALVDGYEIEEEKKYTVQILDSSTDDYSIILGYRDGKVCIRQFLSSTWKMNCSNQLTKPELEAAGFGWVFDCEGVEVQEVE